MMIATQLDHQRSREVRPQTRLRPAVLGAAGYAGQELVRILSGHPNVEAPVLLSREDSSDATPQTPRPLGWDTLKEEGVDLLFLATPHDVSRRLVPQALELGLRVIDLSGAWRLRHAANRSVYQFEDEGTVSEKLAERAIYGLPELHRAEIETADLVANPGCYATSIILALAPLLRAECVDIEHGIISDSKSGVSGAGKALSKRTHFMSVADNCSAYSLFNHRHVGEIAEQLAIEPTNLTFTPHLLPIPRGILSTIYVRLNRKMTAAAVDGCFRDFYAGEPWVRVLTPGTLPEIHSSLQTNYCDVGFGVADDGRRLVMVSCLDNLLKGAAGQAVQNMNAMYGWDEKEGLV
jgi:N-acetyl-gamma-glutamyl-phosphate reductase